MSLINKMLQDLDLRRAGSGPAQPFGQQVRAVPARQRVKPAWLAAAVLTAAAVAIVAWLRLYQASGQPAASATGNQPPVPAPASASAVMAKSGVAVQAPATGPANPVQAAARQLAPGSLVAAAAPLAVAALPGKSATPGGWPVDKATGPVTVAAVAPAPSSPLVKPVAYGAKPPAESVAAAPMMPAGRKRNIAASATATTDAAPAAEIEIQVKESTPQQLAENAYRKALLAAQQGQRAEMVSQLDQALLHDPRHSAARLVLVGELASSDRRDDAIRIARYGVSLDPSQSVLTMALARLLVEKGELRMAIATLEQGLQASADRADYQAFLAALMQRDGKHKQAVEHYRVALQGAPQNGIWWMGLGISQHAENNVAAARDAYRRAKATNTLSIDMLAFVEAQLEQLR